MNIAKLILGNLSKFSHNEPVTKELIQIVYAVINNQNGGKLPAMSDNLANLIWSIATGDYCKELLENWSKDYERSRSQPQQSASFANDIHSKILQGIGKESAGKH